MNNLDAFMIIKNGIRLGYPFAESIMALLPYVDRIWIEDGYSDDNTFFVLQALAYKHPSISLSRYRWKQMQTGFSIGDATNHLLDRILIAASRAEWLLYVQGDELWRPESLKAVRDWIAEPASARYDSVAFDFLHIAENYQKLQFEPGKESYKQAIRMIRNRSNIRSHRDAWTFEGCRNTLTMRPRSEGGATIVHANSTGFYNWVSKARSHADTMYPDLKFYAATADEREAIAESGIIPEHWLAKTSPFESELPEEVLPTIGQLTYEVDMERLGLS